MTVWQKRTPEVAYLLNPAFCATVLYVAIREYQERAFCGFPFPLIYLVLPIVLHKDTRERINSRSNMISWLQNNPDVLVNFALRARDLVVFTNEALEFLLSQEAIAFDNSSIMISNEIQKARLSRYKKKDPEISDCLIKSEHVARWFVNMRVEENIYAAWGVKP